MGLWLKPILSMVKLMVKDLRYFRSIMNIMSVILLIITLMAGVSTIVVTLTTLENSGIVCFMAKVNSGWQKVMRFSLELFLMAKWRREHWHGKVRLQERLGWLSNTNTEASLKTENLKTNKVFSEITLVYTEEDLRRVKRMARGISSLNSITSMKDNTKTI